MLVECSPNVTRDIAFVQLLFFFFFGHVPHSLTLGGGENTQNQQAGGCKEVTFALLSPTTRWTDYSGRVFFLHGIFFFPPISL